MDGIEVLAVDTGGTILDWQSGIVRVLAGTGAPRAVEHDWCTRGAEDRERSRYPGLLHPHCGHALRNKLIELTRWRAAFATGHPAQQSSIGRLRASCRQLEARDAHVAPGDAAKAACGFEDKIMVRTLAHHMALEFRPTMELVGPRREFNRDSGPACRSSDHATI